jgi:hypothetical protein
VLNTPDTMAQRASPMRFWADFMTVFEAGMWSPETFPAHP